MIKTRLSALNTKAPKNNSRKLSLLELKKMGRVKFPNFPGGSGIDVDSTNWNNLVLAEVSPELSKYKVELVCKTRKGNKRMFHIRSTDILLLNQIATKFVNLIGKPASNFLSLPLVELK